MSTTLSAGSTYQITHLEDLRHKFCVKKKKNIFFNFSARWSKIVIVTEKIFFIDKKFTALAFYFFTHTLKKGAYHDVSDSHSHFTGNLS